MDESVIVYRAKKALWSGRDTRISLLYPIPDFVYEIQFDQKPPAGCCVPFPLKSEVKIAPDIVVKFHRSVEATADDNNNDYDEVMQGLICKLEFNQI